MKLKEPKVFTLEEARRTLPLVQKIVSDIIQGTETVRHWESAQQTKNHAPSHEVRETIRQAKEDLAAFQQELEQVGCHLKDSYIGIVGYYWDRGDGLIAELCWKYGEEDILHWHDVGSTEIKRLPGGGTGPR